MNSEFVSGGMDLRMSKHILVIDDEEGIRDSFKLALEDGPYIVETAKTGEEGIEKAGITKPHLIFLDLKMPGMGGIEALRYLHKICPDIPIYIVTAFHKEYFQQLEEVLKDGVDCEVFSKPVDIHKIKELVDSILG